MAWSKANFLRKKGMAANTFRGQASLLLDICLLANHGRFTYSGSASSRTAPLMVQVPVVEFFLPIFLGLSVDKWKPSWRCCEGQRVAKSANALTKGKYINNLPKSGGKLSLNPVRTSSLVSSALDPPLVQRGWKAQHQQLTLPPG